MLVCCICILCVVYTVLYMLYCNVSNVSFFGLCMRVLSVSRVCVHISCLYLKCICLKTVHGTWLGHVYCAVYCVPVLYMGAYMVAKGIRVLTARFAKARNSERSPIQKSGSGF